MTQRKCVACGSKHLEPGNIVGTGSAYFRPTNAKFLTFRTSGVRLYGNICMSCGLVMLVGDIEKVSDLTSRAEPH